MISNWLDALILGLSYYTRFLHGVDGRHAPPPCRYDGRCEMRITVFLGENAYF